MGYYDQGRVRVPAGACRSIRRQAVRGVSMALLSRTAEALLVAPCREMHPKVGFVSRSSGDVPTAAWGETNQIGFVFSPFLN